MRLDERIELVQLLYRLQRELLDEAETNGDEYSDDGVLDEAIRLLLFYLD